MSDVEDPSLPLKDGKTNRRIIKTVKAAGKHYIVILNVVKNLLKAKSKRRVCQV
ncbi:MAG: hypothetical protein JWR67_1607 [Mucilaginibacter sp.]|nr:hypothetical protein [Mucilaginibacter sp.]